MAKFRVIEEDGYYFPQKYSWFKWRFYYNYIFHGEVRLSKVIAFSDDKEAIDYVLDRTVHMQKKIKPKVVFEYEE